MTIKEVLNWANKKIKPLEAEVLLTYSLKKDKVWLYQNPDYKPDPDQIKKYQKLAKARSKGKPLAYITNQKEFFGLDFYVDKRVMIPRPETEILVEEVIKEIKRKRAKIIADIGTGSGCIAIVLAKNLPKIKIYATDISKKAIEVAKINAKKHQTSDKIKFFFGDLLTPLPEKVDIICANLPYIPSCWIRALPKDIKFYEPNIALNGGKDGLKLYKKLFFQVSKFLKKGGKIFIEIDPREAKEIQKIAKDSLENKIEFKKDLSGQNRLMIIQTS